MTVSKSVSSIAKQTTPLIVFYAFIELFTGGVFESMKSEIALLPGILILVPPILNMRGSISSSFSARLCSGIHLGYIKVDKVTGDLKREMVANMILTFILSLILPVFAWIVSIFAGIQSIPLTSLMFISLFCGISSAVALMASSILLSFLSVRKGLDPNNITMPSIASVGDVVTITFLLIAVQLTIVMGLV